MRIRSILIIALGSSFAIGVGASPQTQGRSGSGAATPTTPQGQGRSGSGTAPPAAQGQRRSGGGTATLAIVVTDSTGAPIADVKVILQGPTTRETRTERGRIALEDLPPGNYRLRFEHPRFITLERELVARAGAPMDVKVTLAPAPEPPKPPPPPEPVAAPPPPPTPTVKADPIVLDISAYLEKNFVGRAPSKNSALGCSTGGTATLMQFRDGVPEHAHADADEYLYVVAGTGSAKIAGAEQPLQPSVFVQIPRTVPHTLTVRGKTPLVVLSVKAGEPCGGGTARPGQ